LEGKENLSHTFKRAGEKRKKKPTEVLLATSLEVGAEFRRPRQRIPYRILENPL
jgi:hypothetical protein